MDTSLVDDVMWDDIPESILNEIYQSFDPSVPESPLPQKNDTLPELFEECGSGQIPSQDIAIGSLISKLAAFQEEFIKHIKEYQRSLKKIISNLEHHQMHQQDLVFPIQEQFIKDLTTTQSALLEISQVRKVYIMNPLQIHTLHQAILSLSNQELIIQFFQSELTCAVQGDPLRERMLVVQQQPLPHVVFKGKYIEDRFTIELITSLPEVPKQGQKDCVVLASLHTDDNAPLKGKNVLTNNVSSINGTIAIFPQVKTEISTRMNMVHLIFELKNNANVTLATTIYCPRVHSSFIVITNESQWCQAQEKLITQFCFTNVSEQLPWNEYANMIHHNFLKTSRQDLSNFSRCILPHEFEYLRHKYFAQASFVTVHQAVSFWNWLGPVACALRFKRHINTMWFHGLIYGLISKQDCELVLSEQRLGTFIIRFSESYPGFFAVSYVAPNNEGGTCVMHYLVDHTDIGSQKTLPDFLRSKQQFQYIAQLTPNTGQLICYDKDGALGQYYAKGKYHGGNHNGYTPLVPV